MEVSVDTEQLNAARVALTNFSQAMSDISSRAGKTADSVVEACKQDIEAVNGQKEFAEATVIKLEADIREYDEMEDEIQSEIYQLGARAQQCGNEVEEIDSDIKIYRSKISDLVAHDADKDGGEGEELVNTLREKVRALENQRDILKNEAAQCEKDQFELNSKLSSVRSRRDKTENDLDVQKKRFDRLSTKLDKLRAEIDRVDSELGRYVDAGKVFEASSQSQTDSNISSVERCIALIDEYTGINL